MAEPGAPPPPRTHMALRVEIDGVPWLADVGFGASVPPAPLRLDRNDEQPTLHETFRFIPFGPGLLLQARVRGQWQPLYDLSPEPVLDSHYELFNWFTSTHPTSSFRQRLIAARTTPDARYSLLDNRLTIRWAEGSIERRYLGAEDIALSLEDALGLEVQEDWRPLFQRAAVIG
jgi:N-hydroxyarylamine O-acetyltransferase